MMRRSHLECADDIGLGECEIGSATAARTTRRRGVSEIESDVADDGLNTASSFRRPELKQHVGCLNGVCQTPIRSVRPSTYQSANPLVGCTLAKRIVGKAE